MNAKAEADMAGIAPLDVVFVRTVPAARVAIGATKEHQHLLAFAKRNPAKLDLTRGGPEEGLNRALEADGFFECGPSQSGIVAQLAELDGETGQAIHRGTDDR